MSKKFSAQKFWDKARLRMRRLGMDEEAVNQAMGEIFAGAIQEKIIGADKKLGGYLYAKVGKKF